MDGCFPWEKQPLRFNVTGAVIPQRRHQACAIVSKGLSQYTGVYDALQEISSST